MGIGPISQKMTHSSGNVEVSISIQSLYNSCNFQNIRNKQYESRESFLRDVSLIIQNSELYNGPKSVLTDTSKKMLDLCLQRLAEVGIKYAYSQVYMITSINTRAVTGAEKRHRVLALWQPARIRVTARFSTIRSFL